MAAHPLLRAIHPSLLSSTATFTQRLFSSAAAAGAPASSLPQQPIQGLNQEDKDPDVESRKQAAVRGFMAAQLGSEARAQLAQLLQAHGVLVKGGQDQAMALMDALMAWKEGRRDALNPSSTTPPP